jgi:hypothetical protein
MQLQHVIIQRNNSFYLAHVCNVGKPSVLLVYDRSGDCCLPQRCISISTSVGQVWIMTQSQVLGQLYSCLVPAAACCLLAAAPAAAAANAVLSVRTWCDLQAMFEVAVIH